MRKSPLSLGRGSATMTAKTAEKRPSLHARNEDRQPNKRQTSEDSPDITLSCHRLAFALTHVSSSKKRSSTRNPPDPPRRSCIDPGRQACERAPRCQAKTSDCQHQQDQIHRVINSHRLSFLWLSRRSPSNLRRPAWRSCRSCTLEKELNDGSQTAHVSDNTVAISGELSIECVYNCKICTYCAERRGCVEDYTRTAGRAEIDRAIPSHLVTRLPAGMISVWGYCARTRVVVSSTAAATD